MQYELSEQEVRHMEKYRALNAASQGATELFMERVAHGLSKRKTPTARVGQPGPGTVKKSYPS